ncbi:hypothetical protein MMC29_007989, partial [Sticta canariensis]|nr:hypothetical protein [Sticta canariensis]
QYFKGVDLQIAEHHVTITPCGDGSYCCGDGTDAQDCCDKKKGVFLLNGETTSKNPSGTSSLASDYSTSTSKTSISATLSSVTSSFLGSSSIAPLASSPTTSPPLSRTPASNPQPPTSSKNNAGTIVGGVIGGIAILVLIIGMILILTRQYLHAGSKPKKARSSIAKPPVPHEVSGTDARKDLGARQMQELDASRDFHELHDAGRDFHELQ